MAKISFNMLKSEVTWDSNQILPDDHAILPQAFCPC